MEVLYRELGEGGAEAMPWAHLDLSITDTGPSEELDDSGAIDRLYR